MWIVSLSLLCGSCANATDVRARMLEASKREDPDFPDGKELKLTRFAYIGTVLAQGKELRVVEMAAVLQYMRAPRGQSALYFFDEDCRFVGRYPLRRTSARWCEGSFVYFFGLEGDGEYEGNALDLSDGFDKCRYVMKPSPGCWMPSEKD